MAVYQADDKVMQKSLDMTHALLNIGLGYVPIPVLSEEHYLELMQDYNTNLLELEARAKEPNELELAEEGIEDAEVVVPQPAPTPHTEAPLPIPAKRKRKAPNQQPIDEGVFDASLESKPH